MESLKHTINGAKSTHGGINSKHKSKDGKTGSTEEEHTSVNLLIRKGTLFSGCKQYCYIRPPMNRQ